VRRPLLAWLLGATAVLGAAAVAAASSAPVQVPEASPLALRYYRTGNLWWTVALLWSLAVPALVLFSGLAGRMRAGAARLGGGRWLPTLLLFFAAYTTLVFVTDLPLSFYLGYVRQHAYGLSTQAVGKWWADAGKALAVGLVGGGAAIWMPYLLLRKSPRRWWLWCALAAVPFFCFVMLVTPLWIDPLFNDFGRMRDRALEARILDVAARAGVPADRVWEVEKSVDTRKVNAYVTGFAGSHRVVLWDTLVDRLEDDEVVFVMGHEVGHYALGHVTKGIAVLSLLVLLGLFAVQRTAGALLRRWGDRFGFRELADPASLPLLVLLLNLFSLVAHTPGLAWSRHQEREADRFALELLRDNRSCGTAFVKLQTHNLSNPRPGPLYVLLRASHPPIAQRVAMCNEYRPWESGAPLRYADRVATPVATR
jgi:Zn-dependent protease with chaperone function